MLSGFAPYGSQKQHRHAEHKCHPFAIGSAKDSYLQSREEFEQPIEYHLDLLSGVTLLLLMSKTRFNHILKVLMI